MRRGWSPSGGSYRGSALARGLGWFSVALGTAELVFPGTTGAIAGASDRRGLLRFYGLRELLCGVGILSTRRPTGWIWARAAGDALDLASLAAAGARADGERTGVGVATAAVAGVTALDILAGIRLARLDPRYRGRRTVRVGAIVNRPPDELYRYWRRLENLPRFMTHLESVREIGNRRSHWVVRGPGRTKVEWDAEIVRDRPGESIAWRSVGDPDVRHGGVVRFEPGPRGRGARVTVELLYHPTAGPAGVLVASLFGEEPRQQVREDLRRFKQLVEAGEIPTIAGQPSAARSALVRAIRRIVEPRVATTGPRDRDLRPAASA